jgi:hypothetical protein
VPQLCQALYESLVAWLAYESRLGESLRGFSLLLYMERAGSPYTGCTPVFLRLPLQALS